MAPFFLPRNHRFRWLRFARPLPSKWSPFTQPNAANQGSKYCVIAIGSAAVTALSNEKATLHEYTDFSNWEAQGSGAGFIACGTTSGLTNYQNANTYANAAYNNGW